MTKRIVFNGDDFGRDWFTTEATTDAYVNGQLTSVSLMAVGNDYRHAKKDIIKHKMNFGVHLTIFSEMRKHKYKALTGASAIAPGGVFADRKSGLTSKETVGLVKNEVFAQIDKVLDDGLTPYFIDSHMKFLYDNRDIYGELLAELRAKYRLPILVYSGSTDVPKHILKKAFFGVGSIGGKSSDGIENRLKQRISRCQMDTLWVAMHLSKNDDPSRKLLCKYMSSKRIKEVLEWSQRTLWPEKRK